MTTIAYSKGVMACDSCWTGGNGTQTTSLIKISRLASGALLGQAGDNDGRALEALLDKVKTFDKMPTAIELAATAVDFAGILAFPNGEVAIIEIDRLDDRDIKFTANAYKANHRNCAAVGSGSDIAIGAMDAGASAAQAVNIACYRDPNSKLPVHIIPLQRKQKAKPNAKGKKAARKA